MSVHPKSVCGQAVYGFVFCVALQVAAQAQTATASMETLVAQQKAQAQVAKQATIDAAASTQHAADNSPAAQTPETKAVGLRIATEKDLPHIRYPLHESASSLVVADNADFNSFLSHYSPDLNTLLGGFSIENKQLLLRLLETQEDAAILTGDRKAAEAALEKQKDLETTPAERALLGLSDYAFLHAWKKAGAENGDAFEKAYADDYAHRVNALPWRSVEEQVKAMAANCGTAQPAPQLEYVKVHLDPESNTIHAVTLGEADRIVLARKVMQFDQPTQSPRCAILASYVSSHSAP